MQGLYHIRIKGGIVHDCSSYRIFLLFSLVIILFSCAPTVYSPHAQNEMIAPHNRIGEVHELGIAPALNIWSVSRHEDTVYVQTYPAKSISLYHNAYLAHGEISGIGGIELVTLPSTWLVSGAEGFVFLFKPYLGLQYNSAYVTLRLNFSPISVAGGIGGGEWGAGGNLSKLTFYQLSMLLHNRRESKHVIWFGARNSPAALGAMAGYEHCFTEKHIMRLECSALGKPPFSLLLNAQELERIKGYVLYITAGFFLRLK